jgi:DNA-binding transcriptional LysR family regulator
MRNEPSPLPPLDLFLSFDAAARHLSFTRAGAERFVTQSAISRQIRALERELGVALFRRQHRALALTEDGERLHAVCRGALAQLREAVGQLRAPRRAVLSVSTTPGVAALWLIPRLPGFTSAHPGVDVRIDASIERRDLAADGIDLAIRYARVGASLGAPLFEETTAPVCSPRLLRRPNPPLRKPADLRRHTLLRSVAPQSAGLHADWSNWLRTAGLPDLQPASLLSFNSYADVIAAAIAGQGVALGRYPLVEGLVREGRLVAPLQDRGASTHGYFLLLAPGARDRPAVRALEQWVLEQAMGEQS